VYFQAIDAKMKKKAETSNNITPLDKRQVGISEDYVWEQKHLSFLL